MSTISRNPNEARVPPVVTPFKQSPNAESKPGEFPSSKLLSRSSLHHGNYVCGRSEISDDDLINAAHRGDQQAKRRILRIVQNEEDAEDTLQDTLLRAYTHLSSFRRVCKFSTWLTTIGMNSAFMILRKRKVRREMYLSGSSPGMERAELPEPIDRSPGPEGIYLRQQAILLVRREVNKLKPRLRSVVNHYYGSECSLEEAAKSEEISLGAVKSRLLRGRVRLRSSLARYGIVKFDN